MTKVGQGSRRFSLGDGGNPHHRRVSPVRLVNAVIVQKCARKSSNYSKPLITCTDKFTMRDEVVWDDEERDDVMSMPDRVMGYQSFQRASTPAHVS